MEKLFKKPVVIAVIIAAITVFFALQLPKVHLDNNNIRFLREKNQAKITSDFIDDVFGGQVVILVGLERPFGTVFEPDFLNRVREFSEAVEEIDIVKDINSIMSTSYITGDSDSIIVTDLVPEDFSGTQAEITELRRRIASWDMLQGSIVSNNHQATQVLITLDVSTEEQSSPEVNAAIYKIRNTANDIFARSAEVYITGQPVTSAIINEAMMADIILLIPLVLLVILVVLFFSFRRFTFFYCPS